MIRPDSTRTSPLVQENDGAVLIIGSRATPQEAETELRAQIERALQFGLKPWRLDTHMGALYTRKDFFDVYTNHSPTPKSRLSLKNSASS